MRVENSKLSMIQLLNKTDINASKKYIEEKLNHRLPCADYNDFLLANKHEPDIFDVDYERLNEHCSKFPVVFS